MSLLSDILIHLQQSKDLDNEIDNSGLRERINQLRLWQCKRLLLSYEELYSQKKYQPAMNFFTEELYGPNDFSQRDKDIKKVLPLMESVLSKPTLATFEVALKLNTLSYQCDIDLVKQLPANKPITSELYAKAYRACNNQKARQQQLEYIEILANKLAEIAGRQSIMLMLKLSRKPAKMAGLGDLQGILERGATAFKKMGKIESFIQPILSGEKEIMLKLFSGENCLPDCD